MNVVITQWCRYVPDFECSTLEFYDVLIDEIKRKEVPKIVISWSPHKEGGILSKRRLYLKIRRRNNVFLICAAPFGSGYFFSFYTGIENNFLSLVDRIPFIGRFLVRILYIITYYRLDTASMYQEAIKLSVNKVINLFLVSEGVEEFTKEEFKPILRDVFAR